ncbi:MAG: ribonuclease HII [Alphaproteobacteria bacterium]|nr:ribonuclease HII [Alphaproteobacteria bacterium]
MKSLPDFSFELESGFETVAGVDEAGRGPLCGPVVAAAVVFPNQKSEIINQKLKINDSKKMSAAQRASAYDWIMANCAVGVGQCSPAEIDEINILQASMLAMRRAIGALAVRPEFVLVDGNRMPADVRGRAIVKGDSKSLSIAAASIIAKETRDKIMRDLAEKFPMYGWDKNAGYPTASHLQAIEKYGINEHYRKTFSPVAKIVRRKA